MSKPIVSPKNNKLPRKITFTSALNTVNFDVMCRIKLKRICKGYSQQELAFLLGKPKDYITARERFEDKKEYTFLDTNKLAFILDYDWPCIMPVKYNNNKATYTGSEVRENGRIYHEASIKTGTSSKLLFKIEEDDPEVIPFPEFGEQLLVKLKAFIATLCEIGYFSQERTPFEVFGCCSRTVPGYISVRLVEEAVDHCVQQKKIRRVRKAYITYQNV